jgi:DNA-binding GntR family transcriptional regulator
MEALRNGNAKDAAKAVSADIEHGCKSISEYISKLEKLSGAN